MTTRTTILRAAAAAALAAGIAGAAVSRAGAVLPPPLVLTDLFDDPTSPCASDGISYHLSLLGKVDDGGGYDYFGVLLVDDEGHTLDLDVHRVPVGQHLSELLDDYEFERRESYLVDIRLVDLGIVVPVGDDDTVPAINTALASAVLANLPVDLGDDLPGCPGPSNGDEDGSGGDAPVCVPPLPNPFTDLAPGAAHTANVICAAARGLVNGGPGGLPVTNYGPTLTTTRAQLATMVLHLLTEIGDGAPVAAPDAFSDDSGNVHEASINALAALGIIGGNGEQGSSFFPDRAATRSEMASFMAGAWEVLLGSPLPSGADAFGDDDTDPGEDAINALAAAGIVSGKAPGVFDPGSTVTREQIATFFVRLLGAVG